MKFRYLGTAAAEGIPAIFCDCELCRQARALGGKDIRHRSGAFLNGNLLIDLSPDVYALKLQLDLDLSRVRDVVITHSHSDHFAFSELEMYLPGYAHMRDRAPLTLHGSAETRAFFEKSEALVCPGMLEGQVRFHEVAPFETFEAAGVTFTALPAVHSCEGSFIYLLRQDTVRLLYGNDSGLLRDDVMAYLRTQGPLTHVSLDATMGTMADDIYDGHMTLAQNRATREAMLAQGIADADTRFICTHFSHNAVPTHAGLEELMTPAGFTVAYDGMELL